MPGMRRLALVLSSFCVVLALAASAGALSVGSKAPEIDLADLNDLIGTIELLRSVGALP